MRSSRLCSSERGVPDDSCDKIVTPPREFGRQVRLMAARERRNRGSGRIKAEI